MHSDGIADLLTRIRNAQMVGHPVVRVKSSKINKNILNVLKDQGFISLFEDVKDREGKFDEISVSLKYYDNGEPVIETIKRVSKPGRRIYVGVEDITKTHAGLGISIISTSVGVMTDAEAKRKQVGGELVAQVS